MSNYPFTTDHPNAEYFNACCPGCTQSGGIQSGHNQCHGDANMARLTHNRLEEAVLTAIGWVQPMILRWTDEEVEATSIEDFMLRFYKSDRYHGRGDGYARGLLASHAKNLWEDGFDIISRHDSVTGRVVCYRPIMSAGEIRSGVTAAASGEPVTMSNYRGIASRVHPNYEVCGQKQIDFAGRDRKNAFDKVLEGLNPLSTEGGPWFGMACDVVGVSQAIKAFGGSKQDK